MFSNEVMEREIKSPFRSSRLMIHARSRPIRVLVVFGVASQVLLFLGCNFYTDETGRKKHLPASISTEVPYEIRGTGFGVWAGDEFQIESGQVATYCRLLGVDAPDAGQPDFETARDALRKLICDREVVATVVGRDDWQKCLVVARISTRNSDDDAAGRDRGAGQLDVGLEMIRQGYAWFDGTEMEHAEAYRQAQAVARRERRGIWGNPSDPQPPWEFRRQRGGEDAWLPSR